MRVRELIELLSKYDPDMWVDAWDGQPLDLYAVVHAADAKNVLMTNTEHMTTKRRQKYSENIDHYIDPTEQELYLLLCHYA